jgi:6-phosphogluconolactonase
MARIAVADPLAYHDAAAERITQLIEGTIAIRGTAFVSLTGGSTPRDTYAALADPSRPYRARIDWARVRLFWGDERHVPPAHPDSNFGMADRALLQHVPIRPDHVHRIRAERSDPHEAAAAYASELPDTFDLMLLGLGEDCHIASIFPGSEVLASPGPAAEQARVVAVYAAHLDRWRITISPQEILASRAIVMLVTGEDKAAAVASAIEGPLDVGHCPCQLLREAGDRVEWLLDDGAASRLTRRD